MYVCDLWGGAASTELTSHGRNAKREFVVEPPHTHCVGPSVKCALCKCSPRNVDTCNFRKGDADHICTEARLNTHCLRVLIRISNKLFDHLPLKKELQAD